VRPDKIAFEFESLVRQPPIIHYPGTFQALGCPEYDTLRVAGLLDLLPVRKGTPRYGSGAKGPSAAEADRLRL
jgi:hypothetical protein